MKNDISKADYIITEKGQYLRQAYSDVLGEQTDPGSLRVAAYLDATFGAIEPPLHLSESIEAILRDYRTQHAEGRARYARQPSQQKPGWTIFPRVSLSPNVRIATALILAVLVLAGAGYALPSLEWLYQTHTGTGTILTRQLGKEVNVSGAVEGFTVSVKRVYADPNQIVIGLTVSGPSDRTFNNITPWGEWYGYDSQRKPGRSPILVDKEGREFSGGMGGEQGAVESGTAAYVLTYEGTGLEYSSKEIDVRLKIEGLTAYERTGENSYEDVQVQGPFTFDLTIPVEQGRVANLHQTMHAGGTAVTLERVVTTATGTRLSLRGAGPNADVRLTVGGQTYTLQQPDGMAVPTQWATGSLWEYVSGTSLMDKKGEWQVTVMPGPTLSHVEPESTQIMGGPWIFHFVVP
jgi:hypothetical protein